MQMKNISKRPWKTPSPSVQDNFKSPRFARAIQNKNGVVAKSSKDLEQKQDFGRYHNAIKQFRSDLVNLKEKATKGIVSEDRKKGSLLSLKNNRYLLKTEATQNDPSLTPFNSYFHGVSKQDLATKQIQGEDDKMIYPQSYRECLRKCAAQNLKLKKQLKEVLSRQKLLLSQKQQTRQKKQRTKSILECELIQQLNMLKKRLQENQAQLNDTHLELYKVKKQLYEVEMDKEKYEKQLQIMELQFSRINRQQCQKCQQVGTQVSKYINQLQAKTNQIIQKDNIINGLCGEIRKLQMQIKSYEKPRQAQRKLSQIISELNEDLVKEKLKSMNVKYMK